MKCTISRDKSQIEKTKQAMQSKKLADSDDGKTADISEQICIEGGGENRVQCVRINIGKTLNHCQSLGINY